MNDKTFVMQISSVQPSPFSVTRVAVFKVPTGQGVELKIDCRDTGHTGFNHEVYINLTQMLYVDESPTPPYYSEGEAYTPSIPKP